MYLAAVSPRTSHFLSFIDIYGVMLSGCGDCDSSLSKAVLGLFGAVREAIMYLSPTAKCHTLHRSSFCVPFSVQQGKNMSYFPMAGRGINGIWNQKSLVKLRAIITETVLLSVFIHECPGCMSMMLQKRKTHQPNVKLEARRILKFLIIHELQWKMWQFTSCQQVLKYTAIIYV